MPERSQGVQIRLDPVLKHEARVSLVMANMTWQDLLEPYVRQFVDTREAPTPLPQQPTPEPPRQDSAPDPSLPLDLTRIFGDTHSIQLELGHATYQRWIHRCIRCQRLWVAEQAAPQKCVHCKSPYWRTPRTRQRKEKVMDR